MTRGPNELTAGEREQVQELQREIDSAQDQSRISGETWGRRTSIVLNKAAGALGSSGDQPRDT